MAGPPVTVAAVMALVERGRVPEARAQLKLLVSQRPKEYHTWVCAAWVEQASSSFPAMRAAADRAAKAGAPAAQVELLRAMAATGLGQMAEAVAHAERASRASQGPARLQADAVLAEALHFAHRTDELAALLERSPDLLADPRGQLMLSRVQRKRGQMEDAERTMRALFQNEGQPRIRRMVGFELAKLLDSTQRYDEAFAAAKATHEATGRPYDTRGLVRELEASVAMAQRGQFRALADRARAAREPARSLEGTSPTAAPGIAPSSGTALPPGIAHSTGTAQSSGTAQPPGALPPTALICALPRSGTTLLEQMLDRHSMVQGLGEPPYVEAMAAAFTHFGGWPEGVLHASPEDCARIGQEYVRSARSMHTLAASTMTLDKTLHTWRRLPAVAAALPSAKLLRLRRDPRDAAVSLFLSPMHSQLLGWNASLDDIKQVFQAERACVPILAEALGVDLLDMRYEDFVREPKAHLERTLAFLGLPWEEQCLAPEGNPRVVMTLSHEQVRRPLNMESVARWKKYEKFFDSSWEALNI